MAEFRQGHRQCKSPLTNRQTEQPWTYLLIPHDVITDNKTLKGLVASYAHRVG